MIESIDRKLVPGLKFGRGPQPLVDYLRRAADLFAYDDRCEQPPASLFEDLKELRKAVNTFIESL